MSDDISGPDRYQFDRRVVSLRLTGERQHSFTECAGATRKTVMRRDLDADRRRAPAGIIARDDRARAAQRGRVPGLPLRRLRRRAGRARRPPDHRHRCYAESEPAPRALAHQEAYCLSSAFPVCPTFQEWARREAAHARSGGSPHRRRQGATVPRRCHGASRPAGDGGAIRSPPADGDGTMPPTTTRGRADATSGRSKSGRAAIRRATGPRRRRGRPARAGRRVGRGRGGVGWRCGRRWRGRPRPTSWHRCRTKAAASPAAPPIDSPAAATSADDPDLTSRHAHGHRPSIRQPTRIPSWRAWSAPRERRRPRRSGRPAAGRRRAASPRSARRATGTASASASANANASAGTWPTGRPGKASVATRRIRRSSPGRRCPASPAGRAGRARERAGDRGARAVLPAGPARDLRRRRRRAATPTPTAAVATPTPEPTPVPAPTPQVYVIKEGDTLSKIAQEFGVTLDELLAANTETIKNPDRIVVGDEIIIPVPVPDEVGGGASASAAP